MKDVLWDPQKNERLILERGTSFDKVASKIAANDIEVVENSSRKHQGQRTFLVRIAGYVYMVPFVETDKIVFLKTIIPSRKWTRRRKP